MIIGTQEDVDNLRDTIEYDPHAICLHIDPEKEKQVLARLFGKHDDQLRDVVGEAFLFYRSLIESGLPVEQARAVLPECTYTSLMMSVNFRELMHIYSLRSCMKAEEEIRELVTKMADAVAEIPKDGPFLFGFLKPKCFQCERCSEAKPCGVYTWGR